MQTVEEIIEDKKVEIKAKEHFVQVTENRQKHYEDRLNLAVAKYDLDLYLEYSREIYIARVQIKQFISEIASLENDIERLS